MAHKTVDELNVGDTFLMAGGHYKINGKYTTADMDRVKVTFDSITEPRHHRHVLILNKDTMFMTY